MRRSFRFVPVFVLAAVILIAGIAATPAQLAPPSQPTVTATANTGELLVSWNPVAGAQHYTVGYASPDEMDRMAAAGRNRLDAFTYTTIGAENISHTFTGLELETVYWVTVGAQTDRFGATPVWAQQFAVATTAGEHGDGFCPITGLPLGEEGYLEVGDTATFGKYSVTVSTIEMPEMVTFRRPDGTTYDREAPLGRRWLRIYMHLDNGEDFEVTLARGRDSLLNTDAGNAFQWSGERAVASGQSRDTFLTFDIPQNATTAVWAVRPLTDNAADADNAPALFRFPIPEPSTAIVFGDLNWETALIQTRIAQYIVEEGYDYSTDLRFGSTRPLFDGLRGGNIDVMMELWLPNQEDAWVPAVAAGEAISLGENFRDWQSAFVIPAYMQEQYPQLDSVKDLKDPQYGGLFATAETGGKARLVSCPAGWRCELINSAQVRGYSLSDHVHIVNPANGDALNADLHDAYERGEPWLGFQWGTNDAALLLDLVRLEEPAYSDECWATTRACAYEDATILIAANPGLLHDAPDVAEMLRQWDFDLDSVYREIVKWRAANPGSGINAAAIWWLNNHGNVWEQWVTDEAAASIRAALAAGETPDGWPDQ